MGNELVDRVKAAGSILLRGLNSGAAAWLRGSVPGGASERLGNPYAKSVWVQSAIRLVAGNIGSVPVGIVNESGGMERKREVELVRNPELEVWLREPMRGLGWSDLVEATVGWLKLEGESFWVIPDEAMAPSAGPGRLPQIICVRPDRMKHVLDESGKVLLGWELSDARGRKLPLLTDQVIQVRRWNPNDDWRGLGEWESAQVAGESAYFAGKFKRNLMANNGDTGPYIVAKGGVPSDEQRAQILEDLRTKRQAQLRGEFRPMFLTGDISVEDPKVRTVDAGFIAGVLEDRHEIYVAFGCPPSMADVKAAYSIGSASDLFQLVTGTCMSTGAKLEDAVERFLLAVTKRPLQCRLMWNEHRVMQEVRKEQMATVETLWNKGMPLHEISEYLRLDLPRCEGDEVGYLPFSVTAVGMEKEPTQDQALAEEEQPNAESGNQEAESGPGEEAENAPAEVTECLRVLRDGTDVANRTNSEELWKRHMRSRGPTRKAYEGKVKALLVKFRAEALRKLSEARVVEKALGTVERRGLVDLIFNATAWGEQIKVALRPVTEGALKSAAKQLLEEVGSDDPWTMAPADVLKFLGEREQAISGTGEMIRARINTALQNGVEEGQTQDELADSVRAVFTGLSNYDAQRIASTETTIAYSTARDAAMRHAGIGFKSWLSSHGPHVRPAHAAAEIKYGKNPIPLDEPFDVGGESLMYPGDPAGSAGNIINCQCIQLARKGT